METNVYSELQTNKESEEQLHAEEAFVEHEEEIEETSTSEEVLRRKLDLLVRTGTILMERISISI